MSRFALPDLGEGLHEAEIVAWHVAEGDHVVADQPLVSVETEKAVVEVPSPHAGRIARLLAKPHDRVKVGEPLVEFEEGLHADVGAVVGELTPPAPLPPAPTHPAGAAMPAVRALARERGVDLSALTGHGPGGAVTREDVERAASSAAGGAALLGMRRTMAINMARAHAAVVPATVFDEADIEAWWAPKADVTIRLVRAVAAGCGAAPLLNAWFDGAALTLRPIPQIDLGIAADTEDGLIVPVLRDAGDRDAAALRHELDRLTAAARAHALAPADLRGATITLSNFGMLAGRHAALVVLPPQVAIVGAGRIASRAVPGPKGAVFRHALPLSLTFDHRAATGGDAARFLAAMIDDLRRRD